ncbi:alpha-1-antitrypsin-like [Heteronotia binoei]|uniref:alpha-1-antitrypsin-like n=1 Tax=Heteronotia binoei TaxID=13085 RepID=UPI002931A5A4|nr:alpha-1-antitrypsin-like [Heteronotia binoei]
MSNFYLCLLLAGLCVLASCHHVPGHQGGHDGHEHPPDNQPTAESHQESDHLPCLKIAPSSAEFAFKFYRQIASKTPDKNIFFSPMSISTAFMLVTLGAKGTTRDQIVSGIGFNKSVLSMEEMGNGFRHLLQLLNHPSAHHGGLSVGNALFSTDRYPVQQKFMDEAHDLLQADIVPTNFQNTEEAMKHINSYIEKKTHGKLVDVLNDLDPETAIVLVNYIFMQGYWQRPFNPMFTEKEDFFVNNETTVQVDMMHRTGYYSNYHDEELGCKVLRIPYQGSASALFILPKEGKLKQVEQALGREHLLKWEAGAREWLIELSLPKVSLKTSIDVKEIFQEMGVTEVFTDQADLSGFTEQRNLKISRAVHKGYLNIHENGTEAAATTVIEGVPMSLPRVFKFNRPFLFMIVEHFTRAILFCGKLMNPNEH